MLKGFLFVVLFVTVMWGLIFQLFFPWLRGMPFFPLFRAKEMRELEAEIAAVKQEIATGELRTVLAQMQPQANNVVLDSNGKLK